MTQTLGARVAVKRLHSQAKLPQYAHEGPQGDLAADLYSVEARKIGPGEVTSVRTGIAIELPPGFGAIVEDRSGLALKGLTTLAGVVDTGYRGELKVVVANMGKGEVTINEGDRIAQLRLVQRIQALFFESAEISSSERDTHGFGSTGK